MAFDEKTFNFEDDAEQANEGADREEKVLAEEETPSEGEPAEEESSAEGGPSEVTASAEGGPSEGKASAEGEPPAEEQAPAGASVKPVSAAAAPVPEAAKGSPGTMAKVVLAIAVVAALLIGLLIGAFFIKGPSSAATSPLAGKTTVTEAELNSTVASYTVGGETRDITAKEVIEQTASLDAARTEEGSYQLPSADSALTVARNQVLVADAEAKGITVSDEELAAYASEQLGSSNFSEIAASYGMDESSAVNLLRESCLMSKLRDSVMGDDAKAGELPQPPSEPAVQEKPSQSSSSGGYDADGDGWYDEDYYYDEYDEEPAEEEVDPSKVPTKEYADYIIGLAGDEWDKAKGTWASTDGPYHQALASFEVTPDGATYEAATAAYYVAYQQYTANSTAVAEAWTKYVNALLSNASISIYTLLT